MKAKKWFPLNRRGFLRVTGTSGLFFMFLSPFKLFAFSSSNIIERNDLGAMPNLSGATEFVGDLLNIGQVSDIHIIDPEHYLRARNLKLLGIIDIGNLLDLIPSTSRAQDHLTGLIWDSVIRSINKADNENTLDFVISTGDNTDTDLEHELRWFKEIADGIIPSDYKDRVRHDEVAEIDPEGLNPPWYTVIGNHDVEYMGTFNSERLIGKLIDSIGAPDAEALCNQEESIEIFNDTITEPPWHGFDRMPDDCPKEGYYSFDPKPIFTVLY